MAVVGGGAVEEAERAKSSLGPSDLEASVAGTVPWLGSIVSLLVLSVQSTSPNVRLCITMMSSIWIEAA
jgi:hypothetical protein